MTLVRPIDGNALIEKIDKIDWYHVNEDGKLVSGAKNVSEAYFSAFDIYDAVEYMSTIDAEPVVRCKNCVYSVSENEDFYKDVIFCSHHGKRFSENDYCSNGEHI